MKKLIENIITFVGVENIKMLYPQYAKNNYLNKLLNRFSELLFENYCVGNCKLTIDKFVGKKSIPIMSIHKSKGLEFNTVFFVGIEDQIFWAYNQNPSEELCVFFVAVSRAKENIYFTFCKHRDAHYATQKDVSKFFRLLELSEMVEVLDLIKDTSYKEA